MMGDGLDVDVWIFPGAGERSLISRITASSSDEAAASSFRPGVLAGGGSLNVSVS
jgi:hypothetical protein